MTYTFHRPPFRDRLVDREPLLGTFLKLPTTQPAEIIALLGFDFAVIDEEHAPLNPETTDLILLACRAQGMGCVVRVRAPGDILRVLDCGADGVLLPHVTSAETAREAVALCRYAGGKRGFSPTTRAGCFGGTATAAHLAAEDRRVAVIAMIEDAEAIERIDEIVAVEGLDAIFIGRGDLAVSLGADAGPDDVADATARVMAAARAAGVAISILPADPEEAAVLALAGATAFVTGSDQGFLRAGATAARARFAPVLQARKQGKE